MLYVVIVEGKGRGVFTDRQVVLNETIEKSPVILISKEDMKLIDATNLLYYNFNWENQQGVIGLGYISLYNHSNNPNACFIKHFDTQEMEIKALREIKKDEEITIDYHNDYEGKVTLWFESKE